MSKTDHLKPREIPDAAVEAFVIEYLRSFSKAEAAKASGYTGKHLVSQGYRLFKHPKIAARIEAALKERFAAASIEGERVLRELWDVLIADPNDLVEHRRVACRYCHGAGFKYQRTAGELERDRAKHTRDAEAYERLSKDLVAGPFAAFDEQGGIGYDPRREPHADCPECFGEGDPVVFVKDTRDLSPSARALLAGVKQTKEGIEIKMHSKDKAIELLGKHLALFNEKLDVNITGDLATRIIQARKRSGDEPGKDLV